MRVKFKGLAYSQVRTQVQNWLEENPDIVIEKVRGKKSTGKRTVIIFFREKKT